MCLAKVKRGDRFCMRKALPNKGYCALHQKMYGDHWKTPKYDGPNHHIVQWLQDHDPAVAAVRSIADTQFDVVFPESVQYLTIKPIRIAKNTQVYVDGERLKDKNQLLHALDDAKDVYESFSLSWKLTMDDVWQRTSLTSLRDLVALAPARVEWLFQLFLHKTVIFWPVDRRVGLPALTARLKAVKPRMSTDGKRYTGVTLMFDQFRVRPEE